ncbi:hypothetical protein [Streptomyces sp. NRRL WC-3742]|uniref:hypothetical protein n=1 Tax=Streptomyces sp. NRRL WC-3742 TaxID=1463934 RepID=UPI0004C9D883|nr:hypothetical protein [Streptomyces sp. NRRL WC-3742]
MPTRQLREECSPTTTPDTEPAVAPSRDPVLLGDVLFHTLAEIARRAPAPALPPQRSRPHP